MTSNHHGIGQIESHFLMLGKQVRRTFMVLMLVGGPLVGWLVNADRGLMFGLAVSVLAVVWFLLEQRKIV
jgi:hypothetical protein